MTAGMIGIILFAVFFFLLFLNVPIAVALGLSTILTMILSNSPLNMMADLMFTGMTKSTLMCIPFFVMAGIVMEQGGISKKIVDFAKLLIGPIPGGLAIMSIVVTVFWGAISGSGPATVVALGSVLIPAMIEAGYDRGFAAALIAASAGISVVVPPSIPFVVYGVVANASIGAIFAGGFLPGILMGLSFIVWAIIYSKKHGYKGERFGTPKEIWTTFKDAIWGLLTPVFILGGIYSGVFTPSEAAVFATVYALFISMVVYKTVKIKNIWKILIDSGTSAATVMIIMSCASILSWFITSKGIAKAFSAAILSLNVPEIVTVLLIVFILILAGFFIDGVSIIYIFAPMFLPVILELGYDTVWFGIIFGMAIAVGCITPPVAVNLYPAASLAEINLVRISKSIISFLVAAIISVLICTFFPDIVMVLPRVFNL